MTAAIQAAAGSAAAAMRRVHSVTIGTSAGAFGFSSAGMGSMSPSTLRGRNILALASDAGNSEDFRLLIDGAAVVQTFFSYVEVVDTAGATRKYLPGSATFSGGSQWTWGNGSSPVWTATTPSPREVRIYY